MDPAADVERHMFAVDRRLGVWYRGWNVEYRWMADDYEKSSLAAAIESRTEGWYVVDPHANQEDQEDETLAAEP
jgi:hypothetical protein